MRLRRRVCHARAARRNRRLGSRRSVAGARSFPATGRSRPKQSRRRTPGRFASAPPRQIAGPQFRAACRRRLNRFVRISPSRPLPRRPRRPPGTRAHLARAVESQSFRFERGLRLRGTRLGHAARLTRTAHRSLGKRSAVKLTWFVVAAQRRSGGPVWRTSSGDRRQVHREVEPAIRSLPLPPYVATTIPPPCAEHANRFNAFKGHASR